MLCLCGVHSLVCCLLFTVIIIVYNNCCCVYSWVTVGDDLAPESPAFFCKTCFTMLHYTKDGDKMTQFTAYPYYDEMTSLLGANTHRLNNIS